MSLIISPNQIISHYKTQCMIKTYKTIIKIRGDDNQNNQDTW